MRLGDLYFWLSFVVVFGMGLRVRDLHEECWPSVMALNDAQGIAREVESSQGVNWWPDARQHFLQ